MMRTNRLDMLPTIGLDQLNQFATRVTLRHDIQNYTHIIRIKNSSCQFRIRILYELAICVFQNHRGAFFRDHHSGGMGIA